MKELKYIKLFEAFESERISKTLGFIGRDAKKIFLSQLKDIAKSIDMPISKFSDEYFKYLPFKKALDLKSEPKDEKCNVESSWIAGEFCQGGRIKRTWGNGFRMVECPGCHGTGIVRTGVGKIKYLKFWFTSDGKYVNTTGVDGVLRDQVDTSSIRTTAFSTIKSDYTEVRHITTTRDLWALPTGEILWVSIHSSRVVAMVYRYNNRTYLLQNNSAGSEPPDGGLWRKHGTTCSWVASSYDDYDNVSPILLKRKDIDDKEESGLSYGIGDDLAYKWNNLYNTRYGRIENATDIKLKISDAHFAIVLDLEELKKSEFKKLSEISQDRSQMKKGALKMVKDDQIKKENIERYIKALVDKFNIGEDISGITKVVPRVFGWANCANFIFRGTNINSFNSLVTNIYRFMKADEMHKSYYADRSKNDITNIYKESSKYNKLFNDGIKYVYKRLDDDLKSGNDNTENVIKIFDTYLEVGEIIQKRLLNSEIKDISDLELVYQKVSTIRSIWRSDRFEHLYNLRNMVEYLGSSSPNHAYSYLSGSVEDISNAMSDLETFKKL